MKLFTKLSIALTVALTATFTNAQTTSVTTSELVKMQPINAAELINAVELNLVNSLQQLKVTFANQTINNQKLLISQVKTNQDNKTAETKVILAAD